MKKLIFINGTMGVGKTTVSQKLKLLLKESVFLDGDWCWDMNPFTVNEETKNMVLNNIAYLLNNFLNCSQYRYIIFCWVMHEESIMEEIIKRIDNYQYQLLKFSIICSEEKLKERITRDIENGKREIKVLERSIERIELYKNMDTIKINTDTLTPDKVAEKIRSFIERLK